MILDWRNHADHVAHVGDVVTVWGQDGEWVVTSVDPKPRTPYIRDFGGELVPELMDVTLERWEPLRKPA